MTILRTNLQKTAITLLLTLLVLTGCSRQQDVDTEYGRVRGKSMGQSLNGVSVLSEMFRQQGHKVSKHHKLSPRIERFQTLVWFPNENACPSSTVVDRLEAWLDNGYQRTLILVGRDFTGELDYYKQLVDQSDGEQHELALRALAEVQLARDSDYHPNFLRQWTTVSQEPTCRWYEIESGTRQRAKQIEGDLAATLSADAHPFIEVGSRWKPSEAYPDIYPGRELSVLLSVDSQPFVFSFRDMQNDSENSYWNSDNRAIFVTNGSFLLNYGLINPANQKLASQLIEQCDPGEDVLFLESGPGEIAVSDSDHDAHNQWSWITKQPLCYMVPHFLMWGILFCFTFYPIFGRPRRIDDDQYRSFGDHIAALGKLLGRQGNLQKAKNEIREYQRTAGHEAGHPPKKQPNKPETRKNS